MYNKVVKSLCSSIALMILCCYTSMVMASPAFAPGFTNLPKGTKIVMMPTDIELYEISAGGVLETKADWTDAATKYFRKALAAKFDLIDVHYQELTNDQVDQFAEVNDLHGAVARSIDIHYFGPSVYKLPTKEGKLDWSLGDSVADLRKQTGADYAVFTWVRDSYVSSGRAATMILMALVGIGIPGGKQVGYASLVDLNTGQVVWFNRMIRGVGDLREEKKAKDVLDILLEKFPSSK
jgi:hypothetical protein